MAMEPDRQRQSSEPLDVVTATDATRLLRMALSGTRKLDVAIEHIVQPEGQAWLTSVLARLAPQAAGLPLNEVGLEDLRAMKETGKAAFVSAIEDEETATGALLYFLAIGAALAQHGALITSQPRDEVDDALSDLAGAMSGPWARMLWKGIEATCGDAQDPR